MKTHVCILFLAVLLSVTWHCQAAPMPAIVPGASLWTLETVYTTPGQIMVKVPGQRKPQRFWYVILTMTNRFVRDVPFYPQCDLMTETFNLTQAYRDTKGVVSKKIKKRHKKKYPFLESLEFADNRVLRGEDNARDMVIIWPDFDLEAKNISLFISSLSNETVVIDHPRNVRDENGKVKKIFLRKTLQLDYSITGDKTLRSKSGLVFKGQHWVMR